MSFIDEIIESDGCICEYIKRGNKRIGFLIARKERGGDVKIGYSLCHKNDKFDKDEAKKIAYIRMVRS